MRVTVDMIAAALENSGGLMSGAAAQLNISRPAVSERVKKSARLQDLIARIRESHLDLAETQLVRLIGEGNLGACIFYLKCIGKQRGYVERRELAGSDGEAIQMRVVDVPPRPATYEEWMRQRKAAEEEPT